jgi:hypothetical protein
MSGIIFQLILIYVFPIIREHWEKIAGIALFIGLIVNISKIIRFFAKPGKTYTVIWKKSSRLKPQHLMELRAKSEHGFNEYYYPRKEETAIKGKMKNEKSVFLVGNPLAGKTRTIYQVLKSLDKPGDVIIPRVVDIDAGDFRIPRRLSFWRKGVLILDDLDKFAERQGFEHLLKEFLERDVLIVATCRSGSEYEKLCKKLEEKLSFTFKEPIEIPKVSREEGEQIAEKAGKELPADFDGNIGSIFLPLEAMIKRFESLNKEEKGVL